MTVFRFCKGNQLKT